MKSQFRSCIPAFRRGALLAMEPSTEAALTNAWSAAWADFLVNKIAIAERRAAPWLAEWPLGSANAEYLLMLADLAHISGAVQEDAALLRQALVAYDAHLALAPASQAGLRMRAETLLRLGEYRLAFCAFDVLHHTALDDAEAQAAEEVAPFRLVHDAECIESAVRQGANPDALETAAAWRALATELTEAPKAQGEAADALCRTRVHLLSPAQRALLGPRFGRPLSVPPGLAMGTSSAGAASALRPRTDWTELQGRFASERCVVVDDLLSPDALLELQQYARHGCHFRTMRAGYLGAFPADGVTHPRLLALVEELGIAAPRIVAGHTLGLWWLFKYSDSNPSGIGIHADPAAVNFNLWLTQDDACLEGGGLRVYRHVPQLEQHTTAINHEYVQGEEGALRASLQAAGDVVTVPYKCNRAVMSACKTRTADCPFDGESPLTR